MPVFPRLRTTLASRLVLWFGGVTLLLSALTLGLVSYLAEQAAASRFERVLRQISLTSTTSFEGRLDLVEGAARMMALDIEDGGLDTAAEVEQYLPKVLEANPLLVGAGVVLEPGALKGRDLWNLYAWRSDRGVHPGRLAQLSGAPWFRDLVRGGAEEWSGFQLRGTPAQKVRTFAVPIHRGGRVVGVALADLSVETLSQELSRVEVGQRGYALALDSNLDFVAGSRALAGRPRLDLPPGSLEQLPRTGWGLLLVRSEPLRGERAWVYFRHLSRYDLVLCLVYPTSEVMPEVQLVVATLGLLALGYAVVLLVLVALIARSISQPVRALQEAARAVSAGRLDVEVPVVDTGDELAELPRAFNTMMAGLRDHVERLAVVTREQERVESELAIAARIQESFLDQSGWPRRPDLEVRAACLQAREVGGDFYDYFSLEDGTVGLALGDSSGHGIGAAFFMAGARTLVRAYALAGTTPSQCLEAVNRRLQEENGTMMFVTAVYGVLDPRTGRLEFANAGHPSPLVLRADGSLEALSAPRCPPLGIRHGTRYASREVRLQPGDRLVLFSDGLPEAEEASGARFGQPRLEAALRRLAGDPPAGIVAGVQGAVTAWAAGAEASDDRSLMVVSWPGPRLAVPARVESVEEVHRWVEDLLAEAPRRPVLALQVALEEALVNAVRHGLGPRAAGQVLHLSARLEEGAITVTLEDPGPPFDPTAPRPVPEARQVGGRGLGLMAASVEGLEYAREGDRNVLRLRKSWNP